MAIISGYTYNPIIEGGIVAGADYSSADPYVIMKQDTTDEQAVTSTADTDKIVGIRMNKPGIGAPIEMAIGGVAPVIAGGNITRGDWLTATTGGKAVTTTTNAKSVIGKALRSGVSGDIIPVLLSIGTLAA